MENTKTNWSYNSLRRYILDIHLLILAAVAVAYLFEPVEGYLAVKQIIGLWLASVGGWIILRAIGFSVDKHKKKEEEERCAAQVELDIDTEKTLLKYAYESDLTISEIVETALREYVKKHKELQEKSDASIS